MLGPLHLCPANFEASTPRDYIYFPNLFKLILMQVLAAPVNHGPAAASDAFEGMVCQRAEAATETASPCTRQQLRRQLLGHLSCSLLPLRLETSSRVQTCLKISHPLPLLPACLTKLVHYLRHPLSSRIGHLQQ